MARLYDSNGSLLGGLETAHTPLAPFLDSASMAVHRTPLNPKFGPEETVPGLVCSYGSLAYSYSLVTHDAVSRHPRLSACHNPVETPDERHHCDACGGDYCSVHAEPAAHDCESVILPG